MSAESVLQTKVDLLSGFRLLNILILPFPLYKALCLSILQKLVNTESVNYIHIYLIKMVRRSGQLHKEDLIFSYNLRDEFISDII
jgi:hypothetical protein